MAHPAVAAEEGSMMTPPTMLRLLLVLVCVALAIECIVLAYFVSHMHVAD